MNNRFTNPTQEKFPEIEHYIKILKAFQNGKTIECKARNNTAGDSETQWHISTDIMFNFSYFEFRIK